MSLGENLSGTVVHPLQVLFESLEAFSGSFNFDSLEIDSFGIRIMFGVFNFQFAILQVLGYMYLKLKSTFSVIFIIFTNLFQFGF